MKVLLFVFLYKKLYFLLRKIKDRQKVPFLIVEEGYLFDSCKSRLLQAWLKTFNDIREWHKNDKSEWGCFKGPIQPTVCQLNRSGLVFVFKATSLKAYLVPEKLTSLWKSLRLWVLKVISKGRETSATLHHPRLHSLCVNLTSKWLFSSCEYIGRVQFVLSGPHLCEQSRSTPLRGCCWGCCAQITCAQNAGFENI